MSAIIYTSFLDMDPILLVEGLGHSGFKHTVVVVVVIVRVLGTNVIHLVDTTALGAALDGAVARAGEPDDVVGVGRVAGATEVLLVTVRLDNNGVVEGSCNDEIKTSVLFLLFLCPLYDCRCSLRIQGQVLALVV